MWGQKLERGSLHNNAEIEIGSDISNGGSSMILFTCPFGLKQGERGRGMFWGCRWGHEMVGSVKWCEVVGGDSQLRGACGGMKILLADRWTKISHLRNTPPSRTHSTLDYGVRITVAFRTSLHCVPRGHAKWVSQRAAGHRPLQHNLVCPVVSRRPHFRSSQIRQI